MHMENPARPSRQSDMLINPKERDSMNKSSNHQQTLMNKISSKSMVKPKKRFTVALKTIELKNDQDVSMWSSLHQEKTPKAIWSSSETTMKLY